MKVSHAADRHAAPAGTETFTGAVWMASAFAADGPGTMNSVEVHFEPAARTHWHSHPDGQVLVITEGRGWTQVAGGDPTRIASGDVISVPAGVQHWHGADPASAMTHLSITGEGGTAWDGNAVTDAEYEAVAR
ncbi:MAG: cupin domain-containing protein [Chloroflexi bacterium]|nr:MAG: cupin domain-containing protein [Chloroflexota bacterium]